MNPIDQIYDSEYFILKAEREQERIDALEDAAEDRRQDGGEEEN